MAEGLVIAAPSSGSGKTLVTLAILRALKRLGVAVASGKVGPDYIDPRFHEAASGAPCMNLDPWAMRTSLMRSLAAAQARTTELMIIEGVMGLFDGADNAQGSTADLADSLKLPVVLVVDAARQSQSIAALAMGFKSFRPEVKVEGIILNRVGSPRHEQVLRAALEGIMPVIGAIPRLDHLELPSRHLGLVQAGEIDGLETYLDKAADAVLKHVELAELPSAPVSLFPNVASLPPLAQSIAIASDEAFGFFYSHLAQSWRAQGAELKFFSPIADEAVPGAEAVFLPGGYPELHAGRIAAASNFLGSLRESAQSALIYGECGGFMALGQSIIDAQGQSHQMAGLLPHTTSFAEKQRHLGYRRLAHQSPLPWAPRLRGHEFHYSTMVGGADATPLFAAEDSRGEKLGPLGLRNGRVMGSWIHIIDQELG